MTVYGPPFYDENEWEPDELTLMELIGLPPRSNGFILAPWQLNVIQQYMIDEHGRHWKSHMTQFVESVQVVMSNSVKVFNSIYDEMRRYEDCFKPPPPPKNGPQYNPHARLGRGGRRR